MIKREVFSTDEDDGYYGFIPYEGMTLTFINTSETSVVSTINLFYRNTEGKAYTVAPQPDGTLFQTPTLNTAVSFKDVYLIKDLVLPYGVSLTIGEEIYDTYIDLMRGNEHAYYKVFVHVSSGKVQLLSRTAKHRPYDLGTYASSTEDTNEN